MLLDALRKAGCRLTRARRALLDVLVEADKPLAVPDIVQRLRRAGVAVNKTTAYREVSFLVARGLAAAVDFGDGAKRYELVEGDHHHHFVCMSCKDVAELEIEDSLATVLRKVARQTGAKVTGHAVEFFGLCRSCA